MRLPLGLAALLFASLQTSWALRRPVKREYSTYEYYVLEHNPHTGTRLTDVVDALELELVEQVGELKNFWVLRRQKSSYERRNAIDILEDLKRRARGSLHPRSTDELRARELASSIKHLSLQAPRKRVKRDDSHLWVRQEPSETTNATSRDVAERLHITDPSFGEQWHLVNDESPADMVNVVPVWEMNITGEGVIAAMVDDGLDFESDDLAANFVRRHSDLTIFTGLNTPLFRMRRTRMTSMTTLTFQNLYFSMITMEHAARVKLPLLGTMYVE
jgi:kexin